MAIGMTFELTGNTDELRSLYRTMNGEVTATVPPGLILHTAGPTANGWRVCDIWESREAFDRFFAERLGPAAQKHHMPQPKQLDFWTIESKVQGTAELPVEALR